MSGFFRSHYFMTSYPPSMRLSEVKSPVVRPNSGELPPERPLTSWEVAEAVPLTIQSFGRTPPAFSWPSREVRTCLTTFYPWWPRATHQLRHARGLPGAPLHL